jgi:ATP-dependent RNA helicase DDX60
VKKRKRRPIRSKRAMPRKSSKRDHDRDLQKLSNLNILRTLQDATCETTSGKIHRRIKMLHLAACDWRRGAVGSTEAKVLDVLWALEEMPAFKSADDQIALEKASKDDIKKVKKMERRILRRTEKIKALRRRRKKPMMLLIPRKLFSL